METYYFPDSMDMVPTWGTLVVDSIQSPIVAPMNLAFWVISTVSNAHGYVDPSWAGAVYPQDPTFVITLPADVLAPNFARPSAGTALTTNLILFVAFF